MAVSTEYDASQGNSLRPSRVPAIWLPPIYALNESLNGNLVQQVLVPERRLRVPEDASLRLTDSGSVITALTGDTNPILCIASGTATPDASPHVLRVAADSNWPSAATATWIRHPGFEAIADNSCEHFTRVQRVVDSWRGSFSYIAEDQDRGVKGLRSPQIGALHMILGHWTTTDSAATIVMPTGTGKTETMLSVLISAVCSRLLVLVPTDPLRTQIAAKFLSLGLLKDIGVVGGSALYPVVGTLKHGLTSVEDTDTFFEQCNVIVTTAQLVGRSSIAIQERMAHHCPYLFIDEAHHVAAKTWHAFKERFTHRRIVQFTATPFRNDRKLLGGKIIYNFRLRQALAQGYFKPIRYDPIIELDQASADEAIAKKAVTQLRADRDKDYDHILMARVDSVARANEVFKLYRPYTEFSPVQIHSKMRKAEQEYIRGLIREKKTRIIVCVDMLGEGFDLPELKIAAFHDVKKSLAATLQLAGRFTRTKSNLGDPTFIANIGDPKVSDELRKLYTDDANWNELLPKLSDEIIQEQISLREFLDGFHKFPEDIPLQTVRPAFSTVIYRTTCESWHPEQYIGTLTLKDDLDYYLHDVNESEKTLLLVTARSTTLDWMEVRDVRNLEWNLFIVHWDEDQQLLFINSSNNSSYYREIAEAVAGPVELIKGPTVFRAFSGINRLTLQNVGLAEQLGRLISYTMRSGSDVEAGLSEAQKRNVRKSNIFGCGYENGEKASIGCSYKGRIWSWQRGHLPNLVQWCKATGKKVLDETVDADQILRGTLTPIRVKERPKVMPIGIDWPTKIHKEPETKWEFVFGDMPSVPLYQTELELLTPSEDGPLTFALKASAVSASFTLVFEYRRGVDDCRFEGDASSSVVIKHGNTQTPLDSFFYEDPPIIRFADGSSLEGNLHTALKKSYAPYPADRIRVWNWTGVDITMESQKRPKRTNSIQYRVIQTLLNEPYDVIVDDDSSDEVADVVAACVKDHEIVVDLFHCKFSSEEQPGARVGDLYEVCGQAQKCIHWMNKDQHPELFRKLVRRDQDRMLKDGRASQIEKGTKTDLLKMAELSRSRPLRMHVFIVQPGLSRDHASRAQLELLSVTENYLLETFEIPFTVIANY